jgi:hypothetical protein
VQVKLQGGTIMLRKRILLLVFSFVCLILVIGTPALATPVSNTYVGTWSGEPNLPNPGMLAQGGKFVIEASYDTDNIEGLPSPAEDGRTAFIDPARYFRTRLFGAAFQLSVPLEGLTTIATQTGADHFYLGPGYAPVAEIQFFDAAGAEFRGFEFESDFLPGALIFEIFTEDTNFSGDIVTNSTAQIINGDGGFGLDIDSVTVDVRSEHLGPSGGFENPGVLLSEAVEVVAEAGATPLLYNASTLNLTTDAGTAQVFDPAAPIIPDQVRTAPSLLDMMPRQADNDLGAARTDGEDFLSFDWTVDGTGVGGTESGTRLNRVVTTGGLPPHFENIGTRTVDDVNITVDIQNSGLTKTTDTATWGVLVTEEITELSDADTVTVGYNNSGPSIINASATAQVLDFQFDLSVFDPDLAINSLITDFEMLTIAIAVDSINESSFFSSLIAGASGSGGAQQLVTNANLISQFGLGLHTFRVDVADLAGATVSQEFDFTVQDGGVAPIPEPGTMTLFAMGLVCLGIRSRVRQGGRRF